MTGIKKNKDRGKYRPSKGQVKLQNNGSDRDKTRTKKKTFRKETG